MIEMATGSYPYPVNKAGALIDMLDMTEKHPSPNLTDNGKYSSEFRDFISKWYYSLELYKLQAWLKILKRDQVLLNSWYKNILI